MSPLEIIKYIVELLQGTAYEPWVNALLFMLFTVAVCSAISFLLGKGSRNFVANTASKASEKLKARRGYAPKWESFRLRIEPYVDFSGALFFAFIGLYSATLVGLTLVLAMNKVPWWALLIGLVWILASFFYMRINLEAASWAHQKIKEQRG
ncbi:MAG: hypothetical protein L3J75_06895 [Methylococcaceae bacterium]|nr:hypothetical protein [Methylococcaceae bacterium]